MNTKRLYQSKTLWVNLLLGLIAILSYVTGPDFPVDLSAYTEEIVFFIALGNAILRLVTNKGVSLK